MGWYINNGSGNEGPFSRSELYDLMKSRKVKPATLLLHAQETGSNWARLSDLPELEKLHKLGLEEVKNARQQEAAKKRVEKEVAKQKADAAKQLQDGAIALNDRRSQGEIEAFLRQDQTMDWDSFMVFYKAWDNEERATVLSRFNAPARTEFSQVAAPHGFTFARCSACGDMMMPSSRVEKGEKTPAWMMIIAGFLFAPFCFGIIMIIMGFSMLNNDELKDTIQCLNPQCRASHEA